MLTFGPNFSLGELVHWLVEVGVLGVFFHYILRVLRGTRGLLMLGTTIALLAVLWCSSNYFGLPVLMWFAEKASSFLPFLVIVIFQQEIRRILTMIQVSFQRANARLMAGYEDLEDKDCQQAALLLPTLERMSSAHVGGLIAIEQTVGLESWSVTGSILNAPLRQNQLLETIFFEGGPLHDGGVIIRGMEILAASCTFPLSERDDGNVVNGMRHQAALGLSEQCDAVIVVVSEETGRISVANNGILTPMTDHEMLRKTLNSLLLPLKNDGNGDFIDWLKAGCGCVGRLLRGLGRKHHVLKSSEAKRGKGEAKRGKEEAK